MKGCLRVISKRGKDLVSCLVSHRRKVEVLSLLVILQFRDLDLLVLLNPSDLHSHPCWAHHHRVLFLEVEVSQKGAQTVDSSIQVHVVRHMCFFIVDRPVMLRGYVYY